MRCKCTVYEHRQRQGSRENIRIRATFKVTLPNPEYLSHATFLGYAVKRAAGRTLKVVESIIHDANGTAEGTLEVDKRWT